MYALLCYSLFAALLCCLIQILKHEARLNQRNLRLVVTLEQDCLHSFWELFGWRKHLLRSLLISLNSVLYFIGTILQWSIKPPFSAQNRLEISCLRFLFKYIYFFVVKQHAPLG
jgi:hypothetical protein